MMPSATTWMDPEIITVSEVNQTNIIRYHPYMGSIFFNDIDEFVHKTKTDSQTQKTSF